MNHRLDGAITGWSKNYPDPCVSPETGLRNQKDVVMLNPLICIVSEESSFPADLQRHLIQHGLQRVRSVRRIEALKFFEEVKPDLAIIDSRGKDAGQDLETARLLHRQHRSTPLFLIVRESSETKAIAALRAGVTDYFQQPLDYRELLASIRRHLPVPATPSPVEPDSPQVGEAEPTFIGVDPQIINLKSYIVRAAAIDCNVLITGETGTGKEKVAELVHWHSSRRGRPMVCINCAAVPENLLESELFGYERGAFTGAFSAYPGKLALAEGGTIFLDEIFEMTPYMQAKILRAIDTRKIYRLGGRKSISLNVRIVAATNQDPEDAMTQGTLRQDLYYRLNVARVHLPPLRERQLDILLLLQHFLQEMNCRYGRRVEKFSPDVITLLLSYSWPGNIREVRNLVEALFINLDPQSRGVSLTHLPEAFQLLQEKQEKSQGEKAQLLDALLTTKWNKSEAAQKLQISRMTLYRKMEKFEIRASKSAAGHKD
jgi:DNA-binding NtrC family response regulator